MTAPAPPTDDGSALVLTVAKECEEAGMNIGVSMAFLFIGLLLGFLLGARSKFLATVKLVGQAFVSFALKVGTNEAVQLSQGGGAGDSDQPEPDDPEEEDLGAVVERFLSTTDDRGLDDHPDLYTSPIVMYQIKKAKAEQLTQQRITQLAAEGLTEDEIAEKMANDSISGGSGGQQKNALAMLISAGASFEPAKGGKDTDHLKRLEARRMQRTVDVYLQKTMDVQTKKTEAKRRDKKGAYIKSALQVALEATSEAATRGSEFRSVRNAAVAKGSRNIWRQWYKSAPQMYFGNDTDDEEEARREQKAERNLRAHGGAIDVNALAQLQAEYAMDNSDEEEDRDDQDEKEDLAT